MCLHRTLNSAVVSLTVMHIFLSVCTDNFFMLLCIGVLECLVHVIAWSPYVFIIFPQVQHRDLLHKPQGKPELKFQHDCKSLIWAPLFGSNLLILVRDSNMFGSSRFVAWNMLGARTFRYFDAMVLNSSLHLFTYNLNMKIRPPLGTCSLASTVMKSEWCGLVKGLISK